MESRITTKAIEHISTIRETVLGAIADAKYNDDPNIVNLRTYVTGLAVDIFTPTDFTKKNRAKNNVPQNDLCCAKKATGEQCTRRKKTDLAYCGTHAKGQPHGIMSETDDDAKYVEVWVQTIKGIPFHVDNNYNVYQSEDIIQNKKNPQVIARYELVDDVYSIPDFNI